MSSKKMDWQTPEKILEPVRLMSGGTIGLDPCTTPENPTKAREFFYEDGLSKPWTTLAGEICFTNPPYGRAGGWVQKCGAEDGTESILLVPARPDTRWWHDGVFNEETCSAICWIKGRLTFTGAPGPAPFPSALVYYPDNSHRLDDFHKYFDHLGHITELPR